MKHRKLICLILAVAMCAMCGCTSGHKQPSDKVTGNADPATVTVDLSPRDDATHIVTAKYTG